MIIYDERHIQRGNMQGVQYLESFQHLEKIFIYQQKSTRLDPKFVYKKKVGLSSDNKKKNLW